MCYISIYDGAFWQATYRILIGHLSDTYDWLVIYTMVDACGYQCNYNNWVLLLVNNAYIIKYMIHMPCLTRNMSDTI